MRICLLPSLVLSVVLVCACTGGASLIDRHARFLSEPNAYVCRHTSVAPVVDGKLDDAVWQKAEADLRFVDISGEDFPAPRLKTSVTVLPLCVNLPAE